MSSSGLYAGQIMHRRLRPRMHQLRYRIFSLLLDLDEIDDLDRSLRFFSRGRFNLLSFYDCDHGDGSATPLRDQAIGHLRSIGIATAGRIRLLAMPRVLNFVFNPLSVYFCDRPDGGLAAILYEVHNTFGERHCYVLPVEDCTADVRQHTLKCFHVSPFLPMNLRYSFRVKPPGKIVEIAITVRDNEGPILAAVHAARRWPLSDGVIFKTVAAQPIMTLKVAAGILWEATRLLAKGVRLYRRPVLAAALESDRGDRSRADKKAA